jgi:hypothetical protein
MSWRHNKVLMIPVQGHVQRNLHQLCRKIQSQRLSHISPGRQQELDYVFLCDSNRTFIDMKKLLPVSNSKLITCGNIDQAINILSSPHFTISKGIVIPTKELTM